uniref:Uncharacterized protein n=1 Tax=Arundo donax TaxID=35708 RepID=A0A0A9ENV3_ARUDO
MMVLMSSPGAPSSMRGPQFSRKPVSQFQRLFLRQIA